MLFKSFKMFSFFLSNKKCRLKHVANKMMSWLINEFLWILITNWQEWISNFIDTPGTLCSSIKFYRTPSILQGTPWNSMALRGTLWNYMAFHGTPWILHGIPWILHRTRWHSMELHEYSMELHGYSMELLGTPWKFHGNPWNSMDFYGIPWISMEFHGFPWNSTDVFHTGSPRVLWLSPLNELI